MAHGIDICSCLTKENRCVATSCKGACCLMDLVIRQAGTGVQLAGRPLTNFWRDAGPLRRPGWLSSSACFTSLWRWSVHRSSLLPHQRTHSESKADDLSGKGPVQKSLHFRRALKLNEAPSCHPSHIQQVFIEHLKASVVLKQI